MYRISVENRGDSKFHAASRGYTFVMDTQGEGANPVDTLLAGLCACMGHHVKAFLQEHKIPSTAFVMRVRAGLNEDRVRLGDIAVSIAVKDANLGEAQKGELAGYAERCKLHNTLKGCCSISVVVE